MLRTVRSREAGIATIIERRLNVHGVSVFARELGEGEPILLLHGLPTTSALCHVALGAGHFVPLDAAAAVNACLDGFFASGSLGR